MPAPRSPRCRPRWADNEAVTRENTTSARPDRDASAGDDASTGRTPVTLTVSKENYLKAIAEAELEGEAVIAATLARWLDVSAPAVTTALARLRRDNLILIGPDGHLQLTAEGQEIADRVRRRHHLIERMLTEMFGMEWYKVHEEAERLEHAVSAEFEAKLIEKLGENDVCPHGNAIGFADTPAARRERGWRTLNELPPGEGGTVVSVFERDRGLLEYLDRQGIRPGRQLVVVARNYDDTLTLDLDGERVPLGFSAALKVWMR